MKYKLSTLKDIYDKVPEDRIKTCMDELTTLMLLSKATSGMISEVDKTISKDQVEIQFKFPDTITWEDDGKGSLTVHIKAGEQNLLTVEATHGAL